jgi:hypothetical protein
MTGNIAWNSKNLIGKRYGLLTVISRDKREVGNTVYICKCDCGQEISARSGNLSSGNTRSCGCLRSKNRFMLHGMTGKKVHNTWNRMRVRCNNKSSPDYPRYGGRGIKVCVQWEDSFKQFYKDMGDPPSAEHSLERIDNNKGYYKENCRWATKIEQARNRRTSKVFSHNGKEMCLKEWAVFFKIPYHVLFRRIKQGWSFDAAISMVGSPRGGQSSDRRRLIASARNAPICR